MFLLETIAGRHWEVLKNFHLIISPWVRDIIRLRRDQRAKKLAGEKSAETIELRKEVSDGCEKLIWDFFEGGGQVVIYDANNGTREARHTLAEKFDKAGVHVVMLGQ